MGDNLFLLLKYLLSGYTEIYLQKSGLKTPVVLEKIRKNMLLSYEKSLHLSNYISININSR